MATISRNTIQLSFVGTFCPGYLQCLHQSKHTVILVQLRNYEGHRNNSKSVVTRIYEFIKKLEINSLA